MPTSPNYNLRYPTAADSVDVPRDVENLANDVDAVLSEKNQPNGYPGLDANGQLTPFGAAPLGGILVNAPTDGSDALASINAAQTLASTGGTIILGQGEHIVSDTVVLTKNLRAEPGAILKASNTFPAHTLLRIASPSIRVDNVTLNCNRSGGALCSSAFGVIAGGSGVVGRNIKAFNCKNSAFVISGAGTIVDLYNCEANDCWSGSGTAPGTGGAQGFIVNTGAIMRTHDCRAIDCEVAGYGVDSSAGAGCHIDGYAERCNYAGFYSEKSTGTVGRLIVRTASQFGVVLGNGTVSRLMTDWTVQYLDIQDVGQSYTSIGGGVSPASSAGTAVELYGITWSYFGTIIAKRCRGYGVAITKEPTRGSSDNQFGTILLDQTSAGDFDPGLNLSGDSARNQIGVLEVKGHSFAISNGEVAGNPTDNVIGHLIADSIRWAVWRCTNGQNNRINHCTLRDCFNIDPTNYPALFTFAGTGTTGNTVGRVTHRQIGATAPNAILINKTGAENNRLSDDVFRLEDWDSQCGTTNYDIAPTFDLIRDSLPWGATIKLGAKIYYTSRMLSCVDRPLRIKGHGSGASVINMLSGFADFHGISNWRNSDYGDNATGPRAFSVDTSGVFTVSGVGTAYFNNQRINLTTITSGASAFSTTTPYYIINANSGSGTFQLSLTSGGTAITGGTAGAGTLYLDRRRVPRTIANPIYYAYLEGFTINCSQAPADVNCLSWAHPQETSHVQDISFDNGNTANVAGKIGLYLTANSDTSGSFNGSVQFANLVWYGNKWKHAILALGGGTDLDFEHITTAASEHQQSVLYFQNIGDVTFRDAHVEAYVDPTNTDSTVAIWNFDSCAGVTLQGGVFGGVPGTVSFTVDTGGVFTSTLKVVNGMVVRLPTITTGASAFNTSTPYYVINTGTGTFQLSLTSGGAAITGGTSGSGQARAGLNHAWLRASNSIVSQSVTSPLVIGHRFTNALFQTIWSPNISFIQDSSQSTNIRNFTYNRESEVTLYNANDFWGITQTAVSFRESLVSSAIKTANYTPVSTDANKRISMDATSGSLTFTVPQSVFRVGTVLNVARINTNGNSVSIAPQNANVLISNTIDPGGTATRTLAAPRSEASLLLESINAGVETWHLVGGLT
jgi:hypothetical protein